MKYEIGTEVAYDMNCYCGDCDYEQGYVIYIIDGTEDDDFLNKCYIFSKETMDKIR